MATYDGKAITGAELKEVLKGVSTDINAKQDKLDVELDVAHKRLKLNNVSFTVTPSSD